MALFAAGQAKLAIQAKDLILFFDTDHPDTSDAEAATLPFLEEVCTVASCGQWIDRFVKSIMDEVLVPSFLEENSLGNETTIRRVTASVSDGDALCTGPVVDKCFNDGCDTCIYTFFNGRIKGGAEECQEASVCYPCLDVAPCLTGDYGTVGSFFTNKGAKSGSLGQGSRCEKASCFSGGTCAIAPLPSPPQLLSPPQAPPPQLPPPPLPPRPPLHNPQAVT